MKRKSSFWLSVALIVYSATAFSHGEEIHSAETIEPVVLAPGYETLNYPAPIPGNYKLGDLGDAGDGEVLNTKGESLPLHEVLDGKITVLSFIYRACNDVNGCPLATFVMNQIRQDLQSDAGLVDKVQLVSMSFDPAYDTPESMAEYAASFGESLIEWQFLTSSSDNALQRVLSAYDQSIKREDSIEGENIINHLLRVYIIDEKKRIRNIYNSSLLHADTLVSDIKTLALESESQSESPVEVSSVGPDLPVNTINSDGKIAVADDRSGYAAGEYVSRTTRLQAAGQAADLLSLAKQHNVGLPKLPHVESLTPEKIALGRQLFFDRRLSLNNTISCGMCHLPEQSFTVNELATAVGLEGRTVRRNAPSLLNVGYLDKLFHDGREFSLEHQVWAPLLAHNEMANPSIGYVIHKIAAIPDYQVAFEAAFGQSQPDINTIGEALAAYQRVLVAGNSSFDQWHFSGDQSAVNDGVKRGFELFRGKAGCVACHTMAEDHALFTDNQLHNTGIGYARSMHKNTEPHPVTLAPGVVVMIDPAVYADAAEEIPNDLGLYEITQNPADRWKYRTPGLRNVALTAPYMHNGSLATLSDVIDFYDAGGIENPVLSPLLKPLNLSPQEREDLTHFLGSLSSDSVAVLIRDAQSAPVGDVESDSPDWRKIYLQ